MSENHELPVAILGAGPIGLAAAAHVLERGLTPVIFEKGSTAGAAIRQWGHIRLFSPWQYNVDDAARRLLEPTGWQEPRPTALPFGAELVERYLDPLAAIPSIASVLRFNTEVLAVTRQGMDKTQTRDREHQPFLIRVQGPHGTENHLARAVIDASGTWSQSNPLGQAGLPASGEESARAFLTEPLPDVTGADRARFSGKRVMVVGAGHSAANTLLSLGQVAKAEPGTRLFWAVRGPGSAQRLYGGGDLDGLPARGALGRRLRSLVEDGVVELLTSFSITSLTADDGALTVHASTPDGEREVPVDVLVPATGFRPDLSILRELRLELDPAVEAPRALGPLIDPEFHSCGTVPAHGADVLAHPDQDFYLVGMKSYGRAPTFLLATGYEQVRSVVAAIAGDTDAASAVHLELPETGVCSTDLGGSCDAPAEPTTESGASSCTGDEQAAEAGCCAQPQLLSLGVPTGLAHGRSGDRDY